MILNIPQPAMIHLSRKADGTNDTQAFARDVAAGLSGEKKKLPSRYFYDEAGSKLFQQIMYLPEYYLTRCELELLTTHKQAMIGKFATPGFFHLIDLGAGDALKTKILLKELNREQQNFDYVPVDISGHAMEQLTASLHENLPGVQVQAVVGEYMQALEWLQIHKSERKVVLFLGSNIGNFEPSESVDFLKSIRSYLNAGDKLLMGIDLRKEPETILKAYDDAAGVTAAFNLNLLHHINRELSGNIDVSKFRHFALYDPQEGVMKSYLVSQENQEVYLETTGERFAFEAWEAIHTENSYKYTLKQIKEMGKACGFETEAVFQDERQYFADVLFTVA